MALPNSIFLSLSLLAALSNDVFAKADCPFTGILEVPQLFGKQIQEGPGEQILKAADHKPLPVSASPNGKKLPPIGSKENLVSEEFGYELTGAVVCEVSKGYYRLQNKGEPKNVWVKGQDAGKFYSYEVLVQGLTYFSKSWDGRLFKKPNKPEGLEVLRSKEAGFSELDVKVIDSKRIGGKLWFKVSIPKDKNCNPDERQTYSGEGWIPGNGTGGDANVWYYSRGC